MSPNTAQRAFWGDEAGPVWVRQQAVMDATFAPVLQAVLRRASLQSGQHVLDVGCGAGLSTLAAADKVGPSGFAEGIDISQTLLAQAGARASEVVSFTLADAQTHGFSTAYDTMISRFGVMFFDDTIAALRNMAKALKPQGNMIFAAWGLVPDNPFFTLPARVAKSVLGPVPKSDPDASGPFAWRDAARILPMFEHAGLTATCEEVQMMLTPPGDAQDAADMMREIGPAERAVSYFNATPAQRADLLAALARALVRYETPQGLQIPASINLYRARKRS